MLDPNTISPLSTDFHSTVDLWTKWVKIAQVHLFVDFFQYIGKVARDLQQFEGEKLTDKLHSLEILKNLDMS